MRLPLIVVLALAGCATVPAVTPPPARFAHETLPPGAGEIVLPAPDVERYCDRLMGDGSRYLACYDVRTQTVVRPAGWSDPLNAEALKSHEYAHAWGWPGDHPR